MQLAGRDNSLLGKYKVHTLTPWGCYRHPCSLSLKVASNILHTNAGPFVALSLPAGPCSLKTAFDSYERVYATPPVLGR
jgi:hypothetical protein